MEKTLIRSDEPAVVIDVDHGGGHNRWTGTRVQLRPHGKPLTIVVLTQWATHNCAFFRTLHTRPTSVDTLCNLRSISSAATVRIGRLAYKQSATLSINAHSSNCRVSLSPS